SKMGTDYDTMRNSKNPVKAIRSYYRTQLREGEAVWWIDDDLQKTSTLSPVIKNLTSLDASLRDTIKADIFILFPEVFSSSSHKYEKIPAYLAARYGVVSSSLRDQFTAGGQVDIRIDDDTF